MREPQSRVPPPIFMPQQSPIVVPAGPPAPSSTLLPQRPSAVPRAPHGSPSSSSRTSAAAARPTPIKRHPFPPPKIRLKIHDLYDDGARELLSVLNIGAALEEAVQGVLHALYPAPATISSSTTLPIPGTRSVTLIIRSMPGVAYTTGTDIDPDHKEIHFSTNYIRQIAAARKSEEIRGVLWHETVHCFQWNASGTAPGGLIEGIADWVRLKAGLAPPHWTRSANGEWDAGYQHTGYFLDYLESRFGKGSVVRVNGTLKGGRYREDSFWTDLFGATVKTLWLDYAEWLKKDDDEDLVVVERADPSSAAPDNNSSDGQTPATPNTPSQTTSPPTPP
ncbi:MAG: hypothetical protein M1838_003520 [Thelocarpon superellum]|nr:MAG: hypothetical protein M1838_003520 [Thelocarpon superellum]